MVSYTPTTSDLALLTDPLLEKIEAGEIVMSHPSTWHNPTKPVIRDAITKRVAKGSGRVAGSKDIGVASKETAYMRRKGYRALAEQYIPADLADSPDAIISFRELVDKLIDAATGQQQTVKCAACGEPNVVAFKKDASTLFKLYENLTGKARETQDINVNSQALVAVLNERTPISELKFRSITPELMAERSRQILEADG